MGKESDKEKKEELVAYVDKKIELVMLDAKCTTKVQAEGSYALAKIQKDITERFFEGVREHLIIGRMKGE